MSLVPAKKRRKTVSESSGGDGWGRQVATVRPDDENKILLKCPHHPTCLLSGLEQLLHDDHLCDVIMRVDGVDFNAHRVVLAASSDMLRALLVGGWRETDEKVKMQMQFCLATDPDS